MAPFQVFFVRGVKNLFGRGSNDEKIAAIEEYSKTPIRMRSSFSSPTTLAFPRTFADGNDRQRSVPENPRNLGPFCAIVELARVEEGEAVRWIGDIA